MAVFLLNVCKFNSCGRTFSFLHDLIRHIEENHLDIEQKTIEAIENPTCLPVSCILRIYSNRGEDINSISSIELNSNSLNESHVRKSIISPAISLSTTPTDGSELDEDLDSDSGQSSIDSWATTNADSTTNPLSKFHQIMNVSGKLDENNNSSKLLNGVNKEQQFFVCGFSGCTKRYRSSNSLSHHRRSTHKIGNISHKPLDDSNKKVFNCQICGKVYKTSHGLKNHNINYHNQSSIEKVDLCNSNLVIGSTNSLDHSTQVSSYVQISSNSIKNNNLSSASLKETLFNTITRMKNSNHQSSMGDASSLVDLTRLNLNKCLNGTELMSDNNCAQVSHNIEVVTETKHVPKCPPIISAPTLQQHLLSPIIPKVAST